MIDFLKEGRYPDGPDAQDTENESGAKSVRSAETVLRWLVHNALFGTIWRSWRCVHREMRCAHLSGCDVAVETWIRFAGVRSRGVKRYAPGALPVVSN
jgi:hypothetical protein